MLPRTAPRAVHTDGLFLPFRVPHSRNITLGTSRPSQITQSIRSSPTNRQRQSSQSQDFSHICRIKWTSKHPFNPSQWRFASNKADNSHSPTAPGSAQQNPSKAEAESPWTEEPRSPVPASEQAEHQPGQYKSKLRIENDERQASQPQNESLPDLRYGIPSNFNPETSDTSSSFQSQDSQSTALNITEDPASGGGRREEDAPKEAYVSSIDKRRQALARWMYIAAAAFGVGAFAWLGRDWDSEAEANSHPEAPRGLNPAAWYARFRERLGGQFSHYTEPAFPKLLPDPPSDPTQRMPYTLVLSMEDLLVTSKWTRQDGYKIAKRPGVDYFLRYLCQYYELVIFTTVQFANGDLVIRQLDPYQLCLPIFRDGTRYMNGEHVKDLSYLNRDLSKTIMIDTRHEHARLQPENAIVLPKWTGDRSDAHTSDLVALIPFLEYIAGMELADVRKVLASYKGTHIPTEFHRREMKAREEFNKRFNEAKARRTKPGAGLLSGLSESLGFKSSAGLMQIPGEQSPAEAFAEGKMLSDQLRERGQKQYLHLEQQIRENGESWLKIRAEEEKKLQEEGLKMMTGGMTGWFSGGNK